MDITLPNTSWCWNWLSIHPSCLPHLPEDGAQQSLFSTILQLFQDSSRRGDWMHLPECSCCICLVLFWETGKDIQPERAVEPPQEALCWVPASPRVGSSICLPQVNDRFPLCISFLQGVQMKFPSAGSGGPCRKRGPQAVSGRCFYNSNRE